MRINLGSVFFISQSHAAPREDRATSSTCPRPPAWWESHTVAYCAVKAGVLAVTKSLAVEFASSNVRVNAICPGGVRTPMNAGAASFPDGVNVDLLMRNASKLKDLDFCEPEDIAAAVAFLASQEARFISGTVLSVDGAQTGVGVHRRGETRPASPPSLRTM